MTGDDFGDLAERHLVDRNLFPRRQHHAREVDAAQHGEGKGENHVVGQHFRAAGEGQAVATVTA